MVVDHHKTHSGICIPYIQQCSHLQNSIFGWSPSLYKTGAFVNFEVAGDVLAQNESEMNTCLNELFISTDYGVNRGF